MVNGSDDQNLIGDFFNALRLRRLGRCRTLLRSLENLSHEQPTLKPWCLYLQGILAFEDQHNWAEAERIFTELLQADLGPGLRGRVVFALGRSLDIQGRWEEAIAAFDQSLTLFTELGQAIEKAKAWKHIAISYRKGFTQGDFGPEALRRAIVYYQSALDVLEPIKDPSPDIAWLKGSVWNALGLAYRDLGQWDQAIACYQQDLAICRTLDDRHGIGISHLNLGEVHQKRGQISWPEALEAYQQALSILREFDDRYLEADVLANLAFLYQEMDGYERALDYYGQAIQVIEGVRVGISSEVARAGFFATIVDTYANTILLCVETGHQAQAFDYAERARSRAFLDILAARSPDLSRQIEAQTMTLAEVQAALPAEALLLEYFTTGLEEARLGRAARQQGVQRHRFPPARTLLFAVSRDQIQVHDAGFSPTDLLPQRLDSAVERHFLGPRIRRALYDRLIAPVENLLQSKRRLYLVPHGPLHYIPFQALLAPDGETLLRNDGPQLIYAPSATLLFRYSQTTPSRAPEPCLALGYNGTGEQELHFAEEEVLSIAHLMNGQALVGPAPKKAALYDQAGDYRFLHFSCHGDFDPESPLASALRIAQAETLTVLDIMAHLRLCCDLVTLSACQSGLSRVRRGDELVGLLRAFMYAGAPALVSTLWRVDERSTWILMERFYREVQNGTGFAEALKRAQLYLRNLTRQEAQNFLASSLSSGDGPSAENILPAEDRSGSSMRTVALQQAGTYLKGLAAKSGEGNDEMAVDETNDDRIFRDPFYWASFILVGDHGSGSVEGE